MVMPRQGDVYWVRFGRVTDSGPAGKRPAVVIQNDLLNRSNIRTTVVVLLTSNRKLGSIPPTSFNCFLSIFSKFLSIKISL